MILQDWSGFLATSSIPLFSRLQKWFQKGLENSSKLHVKSTINIRWLRTQSYINRETEQQILNLQILDFFTKNKFVHSWNKSFLWNKIKICRFRIFCSILWTSYLLEGLWFLLDKYSSVAWFNPIHILNHFNIFRIGMILQDWGAFLTTTSISLFSSWQKWFEKGLENSSKVKVFILGQLSVPVVSFVELVKTGYLMGLFGQTICTVCWISALTSQKGFKCTNTHCIRMVSEQDWRLLNSYL